jgi:hypothetical protein
MDTNFGPGYDVKLPNSFPICITGWILSIPKGELKGEKMVKALLEKIKKNHALAMILCCAIPIVGIMALSSLGVLGSWGYFALILICPLGHILMMRGMHSTSKDTQMQQRIEHIDDK